MKTQKGHHDPGEKKEPLKPGLKTSDNDKPQTQVSTLPNLSSAISPQNIQLTPENILYLQRTVGNQAVTGLIQAKLKISQPEEEYEQGTTQIHNSPPSSGPGSRSEPLVEGRRGAVQRIADLRTDAYYRSPVNPNNPVLVWTDGTRLFFSSSEAQITSGRTIPTPEISFTPPDGYISEELHWDRGYLGMTIGGPLVIIARKSGEPDIETSITNTLEQITHIDGGLGLATSAASHTTREGSEFLSANDTTVSLELSGARAEGAIHRITFSDGFFRYRAAGGDHDLYIAQGTNLSAYLVERSSGNIVQTFASGTINAVIPGRNGIIHLEKSMPLLFTSVPYTITIDLRTSPPTISSSLGHTSVESEYASTKVRLQRLGISIEERGLRFSVAELEAIEAALTSGDNRGLTVLINFRTLEGMGTSDPILEISKAIGPNAGGGLAARGSGIPFLFITEPFEASSAESVATVRHEMTHIIMGAIDAINRARLTPQQRANLEGAMRHEARRAQQQDRAGLLRAGEYGAGVAPPSAGSLTTWRGRVGEDPELAAIWVELLRRYTFIPDPEGMGEFRGASLADESRYLGVTEQTGHPADNVDEFVASFVASATVFRSQFRDAVTSAEAAGNASGGRGGSYLRSLYRRAWRIINERYIPLGANPF